MAAPSTMMRPLAPAKPTTTTTSNKTINTKNSTKARTLAPAPAKIAPSQGSRSLKPLIAAKTQSNQQRILPAGFASTSVNHSSATAVKKPAPLAPIKGGKDEAIAAHSYTSKEPKSIISTPITSSLSLKEQARQLKEEREKMAMQEDYESLNSDDDEFSDHDESQSPSSSTTTNMNSMRDIESESILQSNEKVQPKREWVLPARAKPGRKPSEVEPPTKRKAQNRASQRAFRERRQSYLASLEAKVNEYEERGANVSTELQKVARKLKEENDELKKENSSLNAKLQQLEMSLALRNSRSPANSIKVEDVSMHSPHSTSARHENGMPVSMLLEDAPRRTSWDWSISSNKAGQSSLHTSPGEQSSCASEMQRDCGFCTEQSPCVCSGEAVLDFNASSARKQQTQLQPSSLPLRSHLERRAITRQKLWYTVPASQHKAGRQVQICPTANMRRMNDIRALHNQPSPMIRNGSTMLPPPPLQSTRKATLWPIYPLTSPKKNGFSSSSGQPQTPPFSPLSASSPTQQPTIFRMKKALPGSKSAVCSGDPSDCAACATDPALAAFCRAVSSHLQSDGEGGGGGNAVMLDAGNAIPLRKKRIRGMSITNMQRVSSNTPLHLTPQSLYTNGTTGSRGRIAMPPVTRPKLWSISRNSFHCEQNNANATSTSTTNTQTELSSLRRHTTSDVRCATDNISKNVGEREVGIESIPEAWQRIKEHPSFANWQGGLDLLADVVTRKSSDEESNASQSPDNKHTGQLVEEQIPSSRGDGDHQRSQALPTEEDLGRKRRQMEFQQSSKEEHSEQQESISQYNKRRKLYVDRRRVDDVLALMDRGTPSVTASSQLSQTRSNSSSATDEGQACACPLSKIM